MESYHGTTIAKAIQLESIVRQLGRCRYNSTFSIKMEEK